jgi:transducin (beta)-like 1
MSFTSDDVNLLVYRYLQESGFTHTAFAFRNESKLSEELLAGEKPRRGVLINFIQKVTR